MFAAVSAQAENPLSSAELQVVPQYPGGIKEFYNHVGQTFRVPDVDTKKAITAKILVSFVVEKDGTLSSIKILKDPGYGLGEEAARVVKACPKKWIPGEQNGKKVRANYVLPITIKIPANVKEEEKDGGVDLSVPSGRSPSKAATKKQ